MELLAKFPLVDVRETERCTGHCCKAFVLNNMSPEELERRVLRPKKDEPTLMDGAQIFGMVVYLGEFSTPPVPLAIPDAGYPLAHYFTCRHFKDGECTIYDERPEMCRDYPYRGAECQWAGCTRKVEIISGDEAANEAKNSEVDAGSAGCGMEQVGDDDQEAVRVDQGRVEEIGAK